MNIDAAFPAPLGHQPDRLNQVLATPPRMDVKSSTGLNKYTWMRGPSNRVQLTLPPEAKIHPALVHLLPHYLGGRRAFHWTSHQMPPMARTATANHQSTMYHPCPTKLPIPMIRPHFRG